MSGPSPQGVVVISGAGGGLGTAVARRLAGAAPLLLIDRHAPDDLAAQVTDEGGTALAVAADLRDETAITAAVAGADALGPVRHLVHCAALLRMAPIGELSGDEFRTLLDVNVVGSFLLARAVAERIDGGGALVLVSSTAGFMAGPDSLAYGASKHALHAVTQALATHYGARRIRVNAVCPGTMATPLWEREVAADLAERLGRSPETLLEGYAAESLVDRLPTPADVAELVALLLSQAGRAITGQLYPVWGAPVR